MHYKINSLWAAVLCVLLLFSFQPLFSQSKDVKKEAKQLVKSGWQSATSQTILDQLTELENLRLENAKATESHYYFATCTAKRGSQDEANRMAIMLAQNDISCQIQTQISSSATEKSDNENINFISKASVKSGGRLKGFKTIVSIFRKVDRMYEVRVTLLLDSRL